MERAEAALRDQVEQRLRHLIADVVLFNHLVAQQVGLNSSDSQFMTLLEVHGPLTPGQLARLSGLTTGTVTGVIDRLEHAGFVRRDRAEADRRKVVVTRQDEVIAERLAPLYGGHAEHLHAVLQRRSPEELRVIADFLTDLTRRGSDRPPGTSQLPGGWPERKSSPRTAQGG